jgi:hypothetical protein
MRSNTISKAYKTYQIRNFEWVYECILAIIHYTKTIDPIDVELLAELIAAKSKKTSKRSGKFL